MPVPFWAAEWPQLGTPLQAAWAGPLFILRTQLAGKCTRVLWVLWGCGWGDPPGGSEPRQALTVLWGQAPLTPELTVRSMPVSGWMRLCLITVAPGELPAMLAHVCIYCDTCTSIYLFMLWYMRRVTHMNTMIHTWSAYCDTCMEPHVYACRDTGCHNRVHTCVHMCALSTAAPTCLPTWHLAHP